VIADSLSTQCKCHGVSGSCTVKTCYRALPPDLRTTVGPTLRSRYAIAIYVDSRAAPLPPRRPVAKSRGRKSRHDAQPATTTTPAPTPRPAPADKLEAMLASKAVKEEDLVYLTISPDYCLPDMAVGSVGTRDR